MHVMDGLGSSRRRTRVIGWAMVVALALSALVLLAPNARAAEPPLKVLIGSGDDVTFGYSQELFNELYPLETPKVFELNGAGRNYYLKLQAKQLTEKLLHPSIWEPGIVDACPFETTESYIGKGPVGKQLEAAIPGAHGGAPCAYHNVQGFPLEHEYRSGQSQLENVLELIKSNDSGAAAAVHPVQLLLMDMGANDIVHVLSECETEVTEGKWTKAVEENPGEEALTLCVIYHLEDGALAQIGTNIRAALFAIRNGSKFGGVNYTGKIIFAGPYDPFGSVYTPGKEVQPGSNFLMTVANIVMKQAVEPFGACYVNAQRNPAGGPTFARAFNPLVDGKPELEPERLQKWTNMANTSMALNPLAYLDQYKGKNGPDIHPTPKGYEELASLIEEECP